MSIYAIGDLHLSLSSDKPMDIYGPQWQDHPEQIRKNWEAVVGPEDTVIIPGDISWGLKPADALADLEWLAALPGKKVLVKGNHDLWWVSVSRLNALHPDLYFLQNTFYRAEGFHICGARGWVCPGDPEFTEHDGKIYQRELLRLRMSLDGAVADGAQRIIGVLHFPPAEQGKSSGFTDIFEEYGVEQVVYGHIHGLEAQMRCLKGLYRGVGYRLVASDYTGFQPILLA